MILCNCAFNLGSLWEHLAQFERNLGQLGHNLAQLGCNLVPLERNLVPLGRNLAPLGRHLGVIWVTWGSLGCHLGVTWASAVLRLSGNLHELLGTSGNFWESHFPSTVLLSVALSKLLVLLY